MLTESEKRWLRGRELSPRPYCASCINAKICAKTRKQCWCPTDGIDRYDAHILQDALNFCERVAAKLANIHFGTEDCPYCGNHINVNEYCGECKTASTDKRCLACRIKYARLKVEEEMDGK